jgi:hypothetical protein
MNMVENHLPVRKSVLKEKKLKILFVQIHLLTLDHQCQLQLRLLLPIETIVRKDTEVWSCGGLPWWCCFSAMKPEILANQPRFITSKHRHIILLFLSVFVSPLIAPY